MRQSATHHLGVTTPTLLPPGLSSGKTQSRAALRGRYGHFSGACYPQPNLRPKFRATHQRRQIRGQAPIRDDHDCKWGFGRDQLGLRFRQLNVGAARLRDHRRTSRTTLGIAWFGQALGATNAL